MDQSGLAKQKEAKGERGGCVLKQPRLGISRNRRAEEPRRRIQRDQKLETDSAGPDCTGDDGKGPGERPCATTGGGQLRGSDGCVCMAGRRLRGHAGGCGACNDGARQVCRGGAVSRSALALAVCDAARIGGLGALRGQGRDGELRLDRVRRCGDGLR